MNEGKLTIKGKIGKGGARWRGGQTDSVIYHRHASMCARALLFLSFFFFLRAFLPEIVPLAQSPVIPFRRPRGAGFYLGLLFGAVCRETDIQTLLLCFSAFR